MRLDYNDISRTLKSIEKSFNDINLIDRKSKYDISNDEIYFDVSIDENSMYSDFSSDIMIYRYRKYDNE